MIDVVVNVYYKGDSIPTTYIFDEREPLCGFLWDCRTCDNIIDNIDIVIEVANNSYYDNCVQAAKLFATKTIIKKLNAVEIESEETE